MQNIRKILLHWIIQSLDACLILRRIFTIYWKRKKYCEGLSCLCIISCIFIGCCRIGRRSFWRISLLFIAYGVILFSSSQKSIQKDLDSFRSFSNLTSFVKNLNWVFFSVLKLYFKIDFDTFCSIIPID